MEQLKNFLSGKKTYIGIAAALIYGAIIALGYVESSESVWLLIAAWTGVSYRFAIAKSAPPEAPPVE